MVPAPSLGLAEKLSAVLRGTFGQPEAEATLILFGRKHSAVMMALGLADAIPWEGVGGQPNTFEVRALASGGTSEGPVTGRLTLDTAARFVPPAPVPPVRVSRTNSAKGDLSIKFRWATPDALRRVGIATHGYDLFRVARSFAEPRGWNLNPPATDQLLSFVRLAPQSVQRVNDLPVLPRKVFGAADVADFLADPSTAYIRDDHDRFQPGAPPFADGQEFYWFAAARDLLGRPGMLSNGTLGRICDEVPPLPPTGLRVEAVHLWDAAANTAKDRLRVTWKPNSAGEIPKSYYVFRWTAANGAQGISAQTAMPVSGPILHVSGQTSYSILDDGADSPTALANAGQVFWYTVRAADHSVCGANISGDSAPAHGVLRDRFGPVGVTASVKIHCVTACIRSNEPPTLHPDSDPGNGTISLRLVATRTNRLVKSVEFSYFIGVSLQVTPRIYFPDPVAALRHGDDLDKATVLVTLKPGNNESLTIFARAHLANGASGCLGISRATVPGGQVSRVPFFADIDEKDPTAGGVCTVHTVVGGGSAGGGTNGPAGSGPKVILTLTPLEMEYRVYRRVDGAAMCLLHAGTNSAPTNNVVVTTDNTLPITSSTLCYFVQTLDADGNASPFVRVEPCVQLDQPLPAPSLAAGGAGTSAAATGRVAEPASGIPPILALAQFVKFTWTCPSPGLDHFRVFLTDGTLAPPTASTSELTFVESVTEETASEPPVSINYSSFDTARLAAGFGSNAAYSAALPLALGKTYTVYVKAVSAAGVLGPESNRQNVRPGVALQRGQLSPQVPWPARPLTPVGTLFDPRVQPAQLGGIRARRLISPIKASGFASEKSRWARRLC